MKPKIVMDLKNVLKRTGMPQYALAKIIDCPPVNVHRWVTGKTAPSQSWVRLMEENKQLQSLIKDANV